ncbi:MAG: radical SAM protein [Bradymonadales bacterium]|nr:radical SAM protein [Bradymonadales bacterium]
MIEPPEVADRRPYSVNVELTLACNLRCRHCGSSAGKPRPDELSLEEFATCFAELAQLGGEEVCLLGGEPLVRKDWEAICHQVGEAGLRLVLITNGMAVNDEVVRRMAAMPHLHRVGVSLDAAHAEIHDDLRGRSGSHARALWALFSLRDAGIEVGAITTLSRPNLEELQPLAELLLDQQITWQIQVASLGGTRFDSSDHLDRAAFYRVGQFISECRRRYPVDRLPVAGSHDIGHHSEILGPTGELAEWHGCGAGLYTLGIMSDGRIKGCLSQHDDFIEDNLRHRSLVDIWNDPNLFTRNRRFSVEQLEGFCRQCPYGATCRAGCSNVAYTTTGCTFDNPFCFYRIEQEDGLVAHPDRPGGAG